MWRFFKDLEPEILYDPASPLLGIYSKIYKSFYCKDTCTCISIAALFTIVKTWNQPKCPSMVDWIKKMWYIHTMKYYKYPSMVDWNKENIVYTHHEIL